MDAMMIEGLGPPLCRVHMARGVIAMKANWKAVSVVSSILLIFLAPVFCLTKPYDMGFCLILHQNRAYDMGIPQVLAI
jgi:hypothetical protein